MFHRSKYNGFWWQTLFIIATWISGFLAFVFPFSQFLFPWFPSNFPFFTTRERLKCSKTAEDNTIQLDGSASSIEFFIFVILSPNPDASFATPPQSPSRLFKASEVIFYNHIEFPINRRNSHRLFPCVPSSDAKPLREETQQRSRFSFSGEGKCCDEVCFLVLLFYGDCGISDALSQQTLSSITKHTDGCCRETSGELGQMGERLSDASVMAECFRCKRLLQKSVKRRFILRRSLA